MVVQSGSMAPAIRRGSLIFIKPAVDYKQGEIISFRYQLMNSITTTHRIVEVREDWETHFVTKGDANPTTDDFQPTKSLILGKVFLVIPYLGLVVLFSKTLPGLIALVILPAILISYQILFVKNEQY